jgi:hypothetical protein
MSTTWKTTTVRVSRSPEVLLSEFFEAMRMWLDHHCIILADFRGADVEFDALFDNPRDARLFERRFAARSTSDTPVPIPLHLPLTVTAPSQELPVLGGLIHVSTAA